MEDVESEDEEPCAQKNPTDQNDNFHGISLKGLSFFGCKNPNCLFAYESVLKERLPADFDP